LVLNNDVSSFAEEFGTHKVIQEGLSALTCMEHRGACGGDKISGDGAGIMTEIPWKLLDEYRSANCPQPGVGMIFLPRDESKRNQVKDRIEQVCVANELEFLGWREVPVDPAVLGPMARDAMPSIWQFFVKAPERLTNDDSSRDGFERTLYLVRRRFSVELNNAGLVWDDDHEVYVASFSSRTIVYKGMVQSAVLSQFYKDLTDPDYTSKFVIYHRRFSTNTSPRWPLAQPMRTVGHNGEINTLLGNVNWIKAREAAKGTLVEDSGDVRDLVDYDSTENIVTMCNTQDIPSVLEPVVDLDRSDSANLDSVFELMCQSRHRAPCALMAMVPAAYMNSPDLKNNPEITDFYKFHGGLLEAWDGPALLVFSDGKSIGASLDRNGLRPARYSITKDGTVYMMSETGVIPGLQEADIVEKGRLGPGQMINVDLESGDFKDNIKIKSEIAKRKLKLRYVGKACLPLVPFNSHSYFPYQVTLTESGLRSNERMSLRLLATTNDSTMTRPQHLPRALSVGDLRTSVCKFRTWRVLPRRPLIPWEMTLLLLLFQNAPTPCSVISSKDSPRLQTHRSTHFVKELSCRLECP
jgi:glutamate synthase (ferredoxin)